MKESFKWMWSQSRGFRSQLIIYLILGIINIAIGLIFIWISKGLIDIATGRQSGSFWLQVGYLATMLMLMILGNGLRSWMSGRITQKLTNTLRSRFYLSVMCQPWHGREDRTSGDIMSRLSEDLRVLVDCIVNNLPSLVLALVQLAAASCFLFLLQPVLLWILICILPIAIVFSKLYYKTMRRLTSEVRNQEADIQSHLQESVQHRTLLITLRSLPLVQKRLDDKHNLLLRTYIRRLMFTIRANISVRSGFSIGYYTAFVWGAYGLMLGTVTYGMMTAFLQLVAQVQNPIFNLSRQIPALIQATTACDRLREVTKEVTWIPTADTAKEDEPITLELKDVSYRYPDGDKDVLQHLSCRFTPGSRTAIVGATGNGKTTLIRLLLGLLQPTEGQVIGAHPRHFAYVPQGNSLLSGTIRDNLLLGKPDATEEELREALSLSAAQFVYNLPQGLDTVCGERGSGLSEGQAQRIAIARSLLQPGSILIMDESSSALDADTERQILDNICSPQNCKTLIWVTHHLSVQHTLDSVLEI